MYIYTYLTNINLADPKLLKGLLYSISHSSEVYNCSTAQDKQCHERSLMRNLKGAVKQSWAGVMFLFVG